ncbi:MAG TPA: hypothetical protein VGP07_20155 [Polyangia bacterium]|jgi:hypothetical protein
MNRTFSFLFGARRARLFRTLIVLVAVGGAFAGCKQGRGERCQIPSDCGDGLTCPNSCMDTGSNCTCEPIDGTTGTGGTTSVDTGGTTGGGGQGGTIGVGGAGGDVAEGHGGEGGGGQGGEAVGGGGGDAAGGIAGAAGGISGAAGGGGAASVGGAGGV